MQRTGFSTAGLDGLDEVWIPPDADLTQYNRRFNSQIEERMAQGGECVTGEEKVLYNFISGIDCIPHDEWRASSNGAW